MWTRLEHMVRNMLGRFLDKLKMKVGKAGSTFFIKFIEETCNQGWYPGHKRQFALYWYDVEAPFVFNNKLCLFDNSKIFVDKANIFVYK